MFNTDSSFNYNNYIKCIELIDYTYSIYENSINNSVNLNLFHNEMLQKFGLENSVLFETLASPTPIQQNLTIYQQLISHILPIPSLNSSSSLHSPIVNPIQSIFALGGVIKNTNIAVISFRGTSNEPEWILDIQSLNQITISQIKTDSFEPLVNIKMSFPTVQVGDGFLHLYCSFLGHRNNSNGCVCKTQCNKNKCLYYDNGNYSQINYSCKKNIGSCHQPSFSLQHQIYDFLIKHKCKQVILTGHSLGAALTNLSAFHLQYAFSPNFIHSIYSFAPPRTGNIPFAQSLETIKNKFYTIINMNDLIPNSILPILPSQTCFSHVGLIKTFNYLDSSLTDSNYIWLMHSLLTYKSSFSQLI